MTNSLEQVSESEEDRVPLTQERASLSVGQKVKWALVGGLLVAAIFGVAALGSSSSVASTREGADAVRLTAAPAAPAAKPTTKAATAGADDKWWADHGAAFGGNFAKTAVAMKAKIAAAATAATKTKDKAKTPKTKSGKK
jgi:hypothetical protein